MNQIAPIEAGNSLGNSGSLSSILFVATRDLTNEKLISFCLVLCVVAVLTPLMLLTSVKVGFIDRLQSEFIDDPSFREIRPADADLRQDSFFSDIRSWPGVAFAMPSVMLVPREVDVLFPGQQAAFDARLVPSEAADPLLDKLEGTPPSGDDVVVSADVLEAGGLSIGSVFDIVLDRVENDQRKRVQFQVRVSGVIPDEVVQQPTIFATGDMDRDVENYRAGVAVPQRGWGGVVGIPQQSFASLVVLSETALGETVSSTLRIQLGASAVEEQPLATITEQLQWGELNPDARYTHHYILSKASGRFSSNDLKDAEAILRNQSVAVIGVNPALTGTLLDQSVVVSARDARLSPDLADLASAWRTGVDSSFGVNATIFVPESLHADWLEAGRPAAVPLELTLPEGAATSTLQLNVQIGGVAPGDELLVSPSLLAMVYRGISVPLAFDTINGSIAEQSVGFRGFRVVASDIDAVPLLVEDFRERGIAVRAKSDEIVKLRQLERSLDILVLVVASVALSGGFAILSASFFANVQRKRVDFATLRLIGMRRSSISRIPIVQALIVAVLGFALSCVLYYFVSLLLNTVIAVQLGFDGQLSKLYFWHFAFVGGFVAVGSCVASLWASREATQIDPAQAIRSA